MTRGDRSWRLLSAVTLPALLVACGPEEEESPTPSPTPESFSSAFQGGSYGAPYPEAGDVDEDASGDDGAEREVEEADVFVQDGDSLYLLNMYKGLMIFNVSNPDKPQLLGRLPLTGYPVEMYVRDGRAYVVVSDYFTYWRVYGATTDATDSFYGSALSIVDVSDPAMPELMGRINLDGYVSQTRAVGDVIYAVSTRYAYYTCDGSSDSVDMTNVISIDISDPSEPVEVDSLSWPGSWAQVHATSSSLYVVEPDYDYDEGSGTSEGVAEEVAPAEPTPTPKPGAEATPEAMPDTPPREDPPDEPPPDDVEPSSSYYITHVTYVDISDVHGQMEVRDTIDVPGSTYDKFALDEHDGTFRIATQKWDGVSSGTVTIVDVTDPENLSILAGLDIVLPVLETITATRFDGDRGYIVTAERTDPLFIVDLANPASPRLAGQVEMPGQLNHLETLNDRVVALGQDNADEGTWRFAVSLFDVADMDNPSLLDREYIGGTDYSWSEATWDEKAFSLLEDDEDEDDLGRIVVPFSGWDDERYVSTYGIQLLDFSRDALSLRGMATHTEPIYRVRPVNGRLASLSSSHLLMIDDTDPDHPAVTSDTALAMNIVDFVPLSQVGVQLVSNGWYTSNATGRLRVVPLETPEETGTALAEVVIPMYDGQLVPLSDPYLGLIRTTYDANWEGSYFFEVYDLTNLLAPTLRSSLPLTAPVWGTSQSYYGGWYGSSGGVLVKAENALAYLETAYSYWGYPIEDEVGVEPDVDESQPVPADSATSSGKTATLDEPLTRLHIIDITNPLQPSLSSLEFDVSLFGLWADGNTLYANYVVPEEDSSNGKYYVDRIDVSEPLSPLLMAPVNIPGSSLYTPDGGETLLTLDQQWTLSPDGYETLEYALRTVSIDRLGAHSLGSLPLSGYSFSLAFSGDYAFMLTQDYYWDAEPNDCGYYVVPVMLRSVSFAQPDRLVETSSQKLPISYGYVNSVDQGRLFVDGYDQGLLAYDVTSGTPEYQDFVRTSGWISHIRMRNDVAWLSSGYYGVYQMGLE